MKYEENKSLSRNIWILLPLLVIFIGVLGYMWNRSNQAQAKLNMLNQYYPGYTDILNTKDKINLSTLNHPFRTVAGAKLPDGQTFGVWYEGWTNQISSPEAMNISILQLQSTIAVYVNFTPNAFGISTRTFDYTLLKRNGRWVIVPVNKVSAELINNNTNEINSLVAYLGINTSF